MPIYDFKCDSCGAIEERFAKVSDTTGVCSTCNNPMHRIITTRYSVIGDLESYVDYEITGEPIRVQSKQHRAKLLKQHELVEKIGKGWT